MKTTTLISIVVFLQLMVSFMLMSQNNELGDIVQQQRRLLVTDTCHLKHADAISQLVLHLVDYKMAFPDFEAAWRAEHDAYRKACFGAA